MSTRDNEIEEYGFLLTTEQLKAVAQRYFGEDFSESQWDECPHEYYEALVDHFGLRHESSFTGEAFVVGEEGQDTFLDPYTEIDNTVIYMPLKRWSTLLKAAYNSMDEIFQEAKDSKLAKYLPKDTVWDLRHIVGSYYG